jgi:NadR type nicotinamide-nucleotide adenylyltransferase
MEKEFKTAILKTSPKIVVITGAESTGKSTLTEALANYFNVPFIPEIAREYVEHLHERYTYTDVEKIAQKQVEQLNQLKNTNHPFIFVDTWLIITKIWFEVVFKKTPDWFESEFRKTKIDLFLVCDTDLPWIADSIRENGGEKREILQNKYIETIREYNFKYEVVNGKGEERIKNALFRLSNL